ncbi:MAG: hydrogenase [Cyanobacteria bacterium SIG30]|nr:hydrogenase [Cyanobacteria bacterium SIG30]
MTIKILNLIILLFMPFLMLGIIKKTKAFWGGRRGASILQPVYDFIKLFKKDFVISETTSFLFKISPVISIGCAFFASLFVPLANMSAIINIPAGFVIFAYVFGFSKFFALLAAMDTGSSFEGMGASREACFTSIVEPAFFMLLASIMALSGNYTFDALKSIMHNSGIYGILICIFSVAVLFVMILTECSRVPVDDPETHLELTMIHEVMILDNCGSDLVLYTWANAIKMFLLTSLIATIIIPSSLNFVLQIVLYLILMFLVAVIIGTVESSMARIRLSHVFEFIFIMSALALVVLSLVVAGVFGGVN